MQFVFDVICSASYQGYVRFLRAASQFRAEGGEVKVTFRPFELAPGATTEGEPLLEALAKRFGQEAIEHARSNAEAVAREGIELNYDKAIATGTFEAHRLIRQAAVQGRGEEMVERLFRAHFTDGLHVGDADTLAKLAVEVGVDWDADAGAEELQAELTGVRRAGVRGVPVFIFDGGPTWVGAQAEDAYLSELRARV
jgi:predicted DsbA family dithiol-disulfide isomerase